MNTPAGLENEHGQKVCLKSVHLEGQLRGLLLSMQVKQRYLNDSDQNIEASYTFPAGWGVQLLGLSVELNGKRMQAVALAKQNAEQKYEEAIESGDTPVMLEKSTLGIYTANLGNLKPGEEAVITLEYAQLLRFEKGRVRITVPTVMGQRYGDEVQQGHIAPHQTVEPDLFAEYPFTASLDILGPIAQGVIACPSHAVELQTIESGTRVQLTQGGLLDRDFIVTIEELQGASYASASEDDGAYAVIASFCPRLQDQALSPLALKILVDCSGSMQGNSMEQAQEALHELILRLTEADRVSYSRFGSNVIHTSNQLETCTPRYIRNVLAKAVHDTDADMGGTDMAQALTSTFHIRSKQADTHGCDLLLITDGAVWDIEAIVEQAKHSQHRIFAIGVGSAPAESLLKDMAEQSGGACELVSPNEHMAEAVLRMVQRMRSAKTSSVAIQWEGEVLWQSPLPTQVFSEETIHVHARLKHKPTAAPTLRWTVGHTSHEDAAPHIDWSLTGTLPRMVAWAEIESGIDAKAAEALALKHQLASPYTHLFLVHVREEGDKAQGLPQLQKIKQMMAAGWGGMGTVANWDESCSLETSAHMILRTGLDQVSYSSMEVPSVWRTNRTAAAAKVDALAAGGMKDLEIPAFLRKSAGEEAHSEEVEEGLTPQQMLEKFNQLSVTTTQFSDITQQLTQDILGSCVWQVLCDLEADPDDMDSHWACLIGWLSKEVAGMVALTRHSQRMLHAQMAGMDAELLQKVEDQIARAFPNISKSSWGYTANMKKRSMLIRFKKLITGG